MLRFLAFIALAAIASAQSLTSEESLHLVIAQRDYLAAKQSAQEAVQKATKELADAENAAQKKCEQDGKVLDPVKAVCIEKPETKPAQ